MNQSETRIGVLGMGLAGGVHKKEGGVFIHKVIYVGIELNS